MCLVTLDSAGRYDMGHLFHNDELRSINPDVYNELERTVSDQARGLEPRAVMHGLLAERKTALSTEELVAITGKTPLQVDRVVAVLEEAGWVVHFQEDGFDKYIIRGVVRGDD